MLPFSRGGLILICLLAVTCAPQMVAQELTATPAPNLEISTSMTCSEFIELLRSKNRSAGTAIVWLDGYYSGKQGLKALPAGWVRTVSQGLGGTCAITINASRPVLDVIEKLHREYGG